MNPDMGTSAPVRLGTDVSKGSSFCLFILPLQGGHGEKGTATKGDRPPTKGDKAPDKRGQAPDKRGQAPDKRGQAPDKRGTGPDKRDRPLSGNIMEAVQVSPLKGD
jgi:hypothetical protein